MLRIPGLAETNIQIVIAFLLLFIAFMLVYLAFLKDSPEARKTKSRGQYSSSMPLNYSREN